MTAAFRQLGATMRHVRAFPLTLAFLAAFLIYIDGIQTVQFIAFGGALGLGRLAETFGAKRVVLGSLVAWLAAVLIASVLQRGSVPGRGRYAAPSRPPATPRRRRCDALPATPGPCRPGL